MTELRCGVQCGPGGNEVRLNGLPNLRRCRLTMVPRRNSRNGVPVTLDAASLISLKQLQARCPPKTDGYACCSCLFATTSAPDALSMSVRALAAQHALKFELRKLETDGSTRCDAGCAARRT